MNNGEMKSETLVSELVKQVDFLRSENKELSERVSQLELELKSKDDQKNTELKKQKTIMKELKKMAQEEKKRADTLERSREGSYPPSLVISQSDTPSYRARSMTDGQESVSSMSFVESDNIELINRVAELQRNYGDAMHKISLLESENMTLSRENQEKAEVIEEWVRSRPIPPSSRSPPVAPSPRGLSGFKKLIGMGDTNPNQNDVMEMNRKLQRLLEETLSKNLHLQRDLQTLLERTEM